MNIKVELLRNFISELVINNIENFEINADDIANSAAINALSEIQQIVRNENYSDFEAVENIVMVFEKYNLNFGTRHDF